MTTSTTPSPSSRASTPSASARDSIHPAAHSAKRLRQLHFSSADVAMSDDGKKQSIWCLSQFGSLRTPGFLLPSIEQLNGSLVEGKQLLAIRLKRCEWRACKRVLDLFALRIQMMQSKHKKAHGWNTQLGKVMLEESFMFARAKKESRACNRSLQQSVLNVKRKEQIMKFSRAKEQKAKHQFTANSVSASRYEAKFGEAKGLCKNYNSDASFQTSPVPMFPMLLDNTRQENRGRVQGNIPAQYSAHMQPNSISVAYREKNLSNQAGISQRHTAVPIPDGICPDLLLQRLRNAVRDETNSELLLLLESPESSTAQQGGREALQVLKSTSLKAKNNPLRNAIHPNYISAEVVCPIEKSPFVVLLLFKHRDFCQAR
nr:polyadenylate-binding protein 7 isoform X2 [Ipomoea batatas]